jgi:hypothetical protein
VSRAREQVLLDRLVTTLSVSEQAVPVGIRQFLDYDVLLYLSLSDLSKLGVGSGQVDDN